ncbi:MAG: hypothetical protein ACI9MD_002106, partial [Psychrobacter glaciei]
MYLPYLFDLVYKKSAIGNKQINHLIPSMDPNMTSNSDN